jgi:hypothetical protein
VCNACAENAKKAARVRVDSLTGRTASARVLTDKRHSADWYVAVTSKNEDVATVVSTPTSDHNECAHVRLTRLDSAVRADGERDFSWSCVHVCARTRLQLRKK